LVVVVVVVAVVAVVVELLRSLENSEKICRWGDLEFSSDLLDFLWTGEARFELADLSLMEDNLRLGADFRF
jgi:hypothetical protein